MFLLINHHCINVEVTNVPGVFNDKSNNYDVTFIDDNLVKRCSGGEILIGKTVFITTNVNSIRLSERLVTVDEFVIMPRHLINYVYHLSISKQIYTDFAWIDDALIEVINYILARKKHITTTTQRLSIKTIAENISQHSDVLDLLYDRFLGNTSGEFCLSKCGCITTDCNQPVTNESLVSYIIDNYGLSGFALYSEDHDSRLAIIKSWNDLIVLGVDIPRHDRREWLQLLESRLINICMTFLDDRRKLNGYVES